jgi:hypothetical protein
VVGVLGVGAGVDVAAADGGGVVALDADWGA